MTLSYVKGDATDPAGEGSRFIIHVCNNLGLWGAGFVLALSRRWPQPEEAYYAMEQEEDGYRLGKIQIVKVEENLWVVNMIGQHGVGRKREKSLPPIRYKAIREALRQVAFYADSVSYKGPYKSVSIHCPKFGAGLAGGDWSVIEQLLKEELVEKGLNVTVYEFDA